MKNSILKHPIVSITSTMALLLCLNVFPAAAFDASRLSNSSDPWSAFRFGYDAYRSSDKKEAVEAYRYAAEKGHSGAQWKLARMYADRDGVTRDDYQAFRFFQQIVSVGAAPGSADESYVSDALVALAGYCRKGIAGTPVTPDPSVARDLYFQAASLFGNPEAQYQMARMMLEGEGGRPDLKNAARWLRLSAKKGNYKAQATLGDLLFQKGKTVRGLAMMTAALEQSKPADRAWIQSMQEQAFGLAGESDRRTAIALADSILKNGLD